MATYGRRTEDDNANGGIRRGPSVAQRLTKFAEHLSTLVVILAGSTLIWTVLLKSRAAPEAGIIEDVSGLHIDPASAANAVGAGDVVIVEFFDFQCPFCRRHVVDTFPEIRREVLAPGNVKYVAVHFPLENIHPLALSASEAAECAARQGRFWEMHEQLFRSETVLTAAELPMHALRAGVQDMKAFERCLTEHEALDRVRADQAQGRRVGVSGTPAFFVGRMSADGGVELARRIRGTASADTFVREVAELRSRGSHDVATERSFR